ncbi:hypothetical protein BGZ59_010886 [Podila verticillata]|nr:hypothetical protein BGZ59_010886 [Podila verticillata]KAI9233301.1 MAG: hypothetical protein BYD32DRAFT_426324 [Podila humilis]KFH68716.1 hypothetical protein MVEG_05523 [Podila verticillata NRRL 6337]
MPESDNRCAQCNKAASDAASGLKRCAKCRVVRYCSRDCQKTHWKVHKKVCTETAIAQNEDETPPSTSATSPASTTPTPTTKATAAASSPSTTSAPAPTAAKTTTPASPAKKATTPAKPATPATPAKPTNPANKPASKSDGPLKTTILQPFHKLHAKQWLYDRDTDDVYKLLIDTYRLRVEDDYVLEGEVSANSLYGGGNPLEDFKDFLKKCHAKKGLLPPWWTKDCDKDCLAVGTKAGWSSLRSAVEKGDIINHYSDSLMPMQLRMMGEQVFGRGPGGQNGDSMLRIQMQSEIAGVKGVTTQLDLSTILKHMGKK